MTQATLDRTGDRDQRLAALLDDLLARKARGEAVDADGLAAGHPDLAEELRALWAAAQFADAMRRPAPVSRAPAYTPAPSDTPSRPDLPRDFGDYVLLEEVGRGGMGVVYKARQKSLNRPVALKMVRDGHLASAGDRARFRHEAEAAARLKHPNIVTVHEVSEQDGHAFFVMELIEGETLAQRVARGPLTSLEAARLVSAIARAVQHAHERGVLHRDLKPSNILLKPNPAPSRSDGTTLSAGGPAWTPFVTDFGLAKRTRAADESVPGFHTQTGAIVGTPSYMPPEQAAGSRGSIGPTADVYALGAVLYECLTGRPPFQGPTPVDTLLMVLEQEPVPPRWLNPKVDRDLELICLKSLQKPPELRYPTAQALADDLGAFASGESLSAQPSGLRYFLARVLRPTHHAAVLENWGLLWMWHSLQIFLLCLLTQVLDNWVLPESTGGKRDELERHLAFLGLWTVGLVTWGSILWRLRRRAGPVLFVERQIAHAWAAGVCASIFMFVIELQLGLPALALSPVIAVAGGMVFVFKAGILSGEFYLAAAAQFLTALVMPFIPRWGIVLFGAVSALSFFVPGLKYHRQRLATNARLAGESGA